MKNGFSWPFSLSLSLWPWRSVSFSSTNLSQEKVTIFSISKWFFSCYELSYCSDHWNHKRRKVNFSCKIQKQNHKYLIPRFIPHWKHYFEGSYFSVPRNQSQFIFVDYSSLFTFWKEGGFRKKLHFRITFWLKFWKLERKIFKYWKKSGAKIALSNPAKLPILDHFLIDLYVCCILSSKVLKAVNERDDVFFDGDAWMKCMKKNPKILMDSSSIERWIFGRVLLKVCFPEASFFTSLSSFSLSLWDLSSPCRSSHHFLFFSSSTFFFSLLEEVFSFFFFSLSLRPFTGKWLPEWWIATSWIITL